MACGKYGKWETIGQVLNDFRRCLYDLEMFENLYKEEKIPVVWERYIKEGFKNIMCSYLEMTKAMVYFGGSAYRIKGSTFEKLIKEAEHYNILPRDSFEILNTLRLLRNEDSHGYDCPEFEDMYNLYLSSKHKFVEIIEHCKVLEYRENKLEKHKTGRLQL